MSAFQVNLRIDNAYNKKSLFSDTFTIGFVLMNAYNLRFFLCILCFKAGFNSSSPVFKSINKSSLGIDLIRLSKLLLKHLLFFFKPFIKLSHHIKHRLLIGERRKIRKQNLPRRFRILSLFLKHKDAFGMSFVFKNRFWQLQQCVDMNLIFEKLFQLAALGALKQMIRNHKK